MSRRFTAERYSNCAECEDLIEPGDEAGYYNGVQGALCDSCLIDLEENWPGDDDGWS